MGPDLDKTRVCKTTDRGGPALDHVVCQSGCSGRGASTVPVNGECEFPWMDLQTLLPEVVLPSYPPVPSTWPGDPSTTRPGQFWRLMRGDGDWAWGGIYQTLLPDRGELITQRWVLTSVNPNCLYPLHLAGHPTASPLSDFTPRCTHRLLVHLARCHRKGTIRAEFEDTPQLTRFAPTSWLANIRPLLRSSSSWSIFTDASWRAIQPIPVEAVFGIQSSHTGCGALFLSADHHHWCADTLALRFEIPPTLHSLGGSALVAELLAIHTGLQLLRALQLRRTVYSDCLSAIKKINRGWSPGQAFTEAGAALVSASRHYLSESISLQWVKGHPERSDAPHSAWSRHQWGIYIADALTKNRDISSLQFSPLPFLRTDVIPITDILSSTPHIGSWLWLGQEGTPPLGNLRLLLSHHRALAYRSNRDTLRALRGAPPTGLNHTAHLGSSLRPSALNLFGPVCTSSAPFGTSDGMAKIGPLPPSPLTPR